MNGQPLIARPATALTTYIIAAFVTSVVVVATVMHAIGSFIPSFFALAAHLLITIWAAAVYAVSASQNRKPYIALFVMWYIAEVAAIVASAFQNFVL